jgi:integrase
LLQTGDGECLEHASTTASSIGGLAQKVIRIITETGLRIYKELTPTRKDQVDLQNAVVWIPDSKTPNGIADVPLTSLAIEAFQSQMAISGEGAFLFPSNRNPSGHQTALKAVIGEPTKWHRQPLML